MEMNTTTRPEEVTMPTTYSAAAKVAEPVDGHTFWQLINLDWNPVIFPRPKAHRRISRNARSFWPDDLPTDATIVQYDRIKRDGSKGFGLAFRHDEPIFHCERLGRIVRWEG